MHAADLPPFFAGSLLPHFSTQLVSLQDLNLSNCVQLADAWLVHLAHMPTLRVLVRVMLGHARRDVSCTCGAAGTSGLVIAGASQDVSLCQSITLCGLKTLEGLTGLKQLLVAGLTSRVGVADGMENYQPAPNQHTGIALPWVPAGVTSLSLQGLRVPVDQQEALLLALPCGLEQLDLSGSQLAAPGSLLPSLARQLPALRSLDLSRGMTQRHLPVGGLQSLSCLTALTCLKLAGVCEDAPLGHAHTPNAEHQAPFQSGKLQLLERHMTAVHGDRMECRGKHAGAGPLFDGRHDSHCSTTSAAQLIPAVVVLPAEDEAMASVDSSASDISMTDQLPSASRPSVRRVLQLQPCSDEAGACLLAPQLRDCSLSDAQASSSGSLNSMASMSSGSSGVNTTISDWLDLQLERIHTQQQQAWMDKFFGERTPPAQSQEWLGQLTSMVELHLQVAV